MLCALCVSFFRREMARNPLRGGNGEWNPKVLDRDSAEEAERKAHSAAYRKERLAALQEEAPKPKAQPKKKTQAKKDEQ